MVKNNTGVLDVNSKPTMVPSWLLSYQGTPAGGPWLALYKQGRRVHNPAKH